MYYYIITLFWFLMTIHFVTGRCLESTICRIILECIKIPDFIQKPQNESKNIDQRMEYTQAFYEADKDYYWETKEGTRISEGPVLFFFETFQKKKNIRLIRMKPEPYTFGIKRNGTYDGELGLVQNGSADISSNIFFNTDDRYEFADYTMPILSSPFCIMMRRAPLMPFTQVLLLPYSPAAWAAILGSLGAAALTWYFNLRMRRHLGDREQFDVSPLGSAFIYVSQVTISIKYVPPYPNFTFWLEVALTGGSTFTPRVASQHVSLAALLLFALVLGNAYTGQLLGFMTAPPHLPEPQTIEETARFLKRLFAFSILNAVFDAPDATAALRSLRSKIELVQPEALHKLIQDGTIGYADGAIVCKECFEFFSEMKNYTMDGKPFLYLMPECLNSPGHQSFLIRKKSPIGELFGDFVMRIMEGGFYFQWVRAQRHQMYVNDLMVPPLRSGPVGDARALRFDQIQGALLLLGVGACVAAVAFACELLFVLRHSDYLTK